MAIIENKKEKFIREIIQSHNKKRALHGAQRLKLSEKLSTSAQTWAQQLIREGRYDLSKSSDYGEAIAWKFASGISKHGLPHGQVVTNDWYDEVQKYDFFSNQYCRGAGHFSQMVWKNSKYIGVGVDWDKNGKIAIVVRYQPAGNIPGHFKENVSVISPVIHNDSSSESENEKEIENEEFEEICFENGQKVKKITKIKKYEIDKGDRTVIRTIKTRKICYLTLNDSNCSFQQRLNQNPDFVIPDPRLPNDSKILKFQNQLIEKINNFRSLHSAQPLCPNDSLHQLAQNWAEIQSDSDETILPNSKTRKLFLGEAISCFWNIDHGTLADDIVDDWKTGSKAYNWSNPHFSTISGNFTQMIWKSTREIGVGICENLEKRRTIMVCYFYPAGNIKGEFASNVSKIEVQPKQFNQPAQQDRQAVQPVQAVQAARTIDSPNSSFNQTSNNDFSFSD